MAKRWRMASVAHAIVSSSTAYRDRWHIKGQRPLGASPDQENLEQLVQRKRALAAGERANALGTSTMDRPSESGVVTRPDIPQGVEL
jgi:hypothetical protein